MRSGPAAPASAIIEPIAATAKMPLGKAQREDIGTERPYRGLRGGERQPQQRDSDATQPPTVMTRKAPGGGYHFDRRLPPMPVVSMPRKDAAMLYAGQAGRLAGVHPKTIAAEGFEDQVLRAEGEHRDEDEDGEEAAPSDRPRLPRGSGGKVPAHAPM